MGPIVAPRRPGQIRGAVYRATSISTALRRPGISGGRRLGEGVPTKRRASGERLPGPPTSRSLAYRSTRRRGAAARRRRLYGLSGGPGIVWDLRPLKFPRYRRRDGQSKYYFGTSDRSGGGPAHRNPAGPRATSRSAVSPLLPIPPRQGISCGSGFYFALVIFNFQLGGRSEWGLQVCVAQNAKLRVYAVSNPRTGTWGPTDRFRHQVNVE